MHRPEDVDERQVQHIGGLDPEEALVAPSSAPEVHEPQPLAVETN